MNYKKRIHLLITVMLITLLGLAGCGGGSDGDDGKDGTPGTDGLTGDTGSPGIPGASGDVQVATFHGAEMLLSTGDFAEAGKYFATATITSATAAVDGTVTVNFTVEDEDANPVAGITGVDFSIVKLLPASGGESFNQWVPYVYRSQTVSGSAEGDWPNPDGTAADQGYRESNGTFTDNGDGSYSYVFATNLSSVVTPVAGTPISYDRSLTHRIALQMGGHSGATAEALFDFVPDGSALTETRNIIDTTSCQGCHGEFQFSGHGGDRLNVEGCVTCHNPSTTDPQGGETLDMKVMIHKIHAGGELPSVHGLDGIVWDDPGTMVDESADNGEYAIWGYRDSKHEWWKVEFPAIIENCTKCHQGTGADVDNWKNVPSRAACGSCHDDVDFVSGVNHGGGANFLDDSECTVCHNPSGPRDRAESVTEAHNWSIKDQRHIPEFDVALTVSAPLNGEYFDDGETPTVSVSLTDVDTGLLVDHAGLTSESNSTAEGCVEDGCPARDNAFTASGLYVHGPRARRVPVLTTSARVEILAFDPAPASTYDLSAVVDDLEITFDGGKDLYTPTTGLSGIERANVSVDLTACTYSDPALATPTEIMACLNADSAFAARGIAYLDEATGLLAIRSRNRADFYSVQLAASDANTAVFNDTAIKVMGGFTVSAALAGSDPKITKFADRIEYQLDPVDDLQPGTYMVGVEIADRGRVSTSDYKTPSVKKAYFQVKQADEEPAIANNCDSCHQGPQGTGFVLDFYRHNKIFDHTAVDQCGQCHDYQSSSASGDAGTSDGWNGSRPIGRRVHAIHYGSSLNYPLLTVNYGNDDPVAGRNWDIGFPRDIRECETCHTDAETSGTWLTKAARSPCSGCHDSDAATAHLKIMTYDPTPSDPWNGDEEESCQVCH